MMLSFMPRPRARKPSPLPFLEGNRISLRPLMRRDVGLEYQKWLNDPEVTRYLEVGRYPVSRQDILNRLGRYNDHSDALIFAIIDKVSSLHIGNVTLSQINRIHGTAETGLMIGRRDFWGKGLAAESWSLVIDYAFRRLGLRKVRAGVIDGNKASEATLRKLGFQEEGRLRRELFADGSYRDAIRFGLFPEEFRPA